MDHHTIAALSIVGTCLDVLGSLYLAYDLLGGRHGPLRLLTRAVTYSILFGMGYGVGLGLFFGIASGIATGVTLSIELNRAARGLPHYSLPWEALLSAFRGMRYWAGYRRRSELLSLHRVLRGPSAGAEAGSDWRGADALRICAAIGAVLVRAV